MRKLFVSLSFLILDIACFAQKDTVRSEFFRDRWHSGDLVSYIEALNDHVVYQGVHTGNWSEGDQLIFSVDGNSYNWNRYYYDGFRIDNRFQVGSTNFRPNMEQHDLVIDPHNSRVWFNSVGDSTDYISFTGNKGNLGGISPGTAWVVHRFHDTGIEDKYNNTIYKRMHIRGSGKLDMAYTTVTEDGSKFRQYVYASYGSRALSNFDQNGIIENNPYYTGEFYKVQTYGQMPVKPNDLFSSLHYMANFSGTTSYGSEFWLNNNEVARLNTYSASVYAKRGTSLTTGLTWASNVVRHKNLEFSRNIIDQDGESFYPWSPDGATHEFSWAVSYDSPLNDWLSLKIDTYNSLIAFSPKTKNFSNEVYVQYMESLLSTPLYRYEWESRAFCAGLLENRAGLYAKSRLAGCLDFGAHLDLTLDGMLLGSGKSKVTPYFEGGVNFDYRPWKWLDIGLALEYSAIRYDLNTIQYFSNDYLSANIYYSGTDKLYSQTGGRYHNYAKGLWQPSYLTLDIPIKLHFGRHEFAFLQTLKKYFNTWQTIFSDGTEANGFTDNGWYFLNPGERSYTVDYLPSSLCGTGFLTGTPYYMSQLSRYTYYGKRLTLSVGWQSLQASSPVPVGNGPALNNFNALCESTANPNTHLVLNNPTGRYQAAGRLDQDKGFILRTYFAYNFGSFLQLGLTAKWTDGQPFSFYQTAISSNSDGSQIAIARGCSRGTNPTDGDFGCRESAIFNLDLHARVFWTLGDMPMSLYVQCYNIWDFGNVLSEYNFSENSVKDGGRGHNLCLTLPRGIQATLKINL